MKPYPFITILVLLSTYAKAQFTINKKVNPYYGHAAIKKKVSELKANTEAAIFRKQPDSTAVKTHRSYLKRTENLYPGNKLITARPQVQEQKNEITGLAFSSGMFASNFDKSAPGERIWSNFLATDFYDNPIGWPADATGAVGESQVIITAKTGIKVFDKKSVTNAPLITSLGYSRDMAPSSLYLSLEAFFSPVLPLGSNIDDPHIRYDRLSKRWFIIAVEINPSAQGNLVLLAVSDGGKVTDQSNFLYYSFNSSLFPYNKNAPKAPYLDFPTLGVDEHSVLIGGNQFGRDSITNVGYVIDKNKLIQGELVLYPYQLGVASYVNDRIGGIYTPYGVQNDDGGTNQSFFAGISYFQDQLVIAKFDYDAKQRPRFISEIFMDIEPFSSPGVISTPGGLVGLNPNDTRLLSAAIHKNKLTGKSSLWTAHAIGVNQSGSYLTGSDSDIVRDSRTGTRWYEIGNIYGAPVLSQTGTLFDASKKSGRRCVQYFNPSIAANGQGHAVLGGTTTAFDQYLNVFVAGRFYKDPKGTLHNAEKATNTNAIYAAYLDLGRGDHYYVNSWGDFSQTVVDPSDDQTIWTFQEYANMDDSYGVRAVQLKAPPPATPIPFGPLSNKTDTTLTLEGLCVENSGFFDPGKDNGGPGYKRLTVKSTGNIVVSNVKFVDPTKITFTLSIKNKPGGNYKLTITNPDGQSVALNYSLQVNNKMVGKKIAPVSTKAPERKLVLLATAAPNPAKDHTNILINTAQGYSGKITLFDLAGKQVFEKSYQFVKGENRVLIPLHNLSNGSYIARIYNSTAVVQATQMIIKQ